MLSAENRGFSSTTSQLLIDVSVIYQGDARTGIQRVVRALLLQLLKAPPEGYRVCPVFSTRQHGYHYAACDFLDQPEHISNTMHRPVQVKKGDLFLALDLAAHLLPRHKSEVLRWKKIGVKIHVLVYDLLPLLHPEWFNSKTALNFKHWIRWIAVYSDNAICISQTVKVELGTWLNARFGLRSADLMTSTIVLGADIDASAPSRGLPPHSGALLDLLRIAPSVLMVGTLEPRKGYDQALAAFEILWHTDCSAPTLVIVGRPGWKTEALQTKLRNHPEAGKRLFWLEEVSDEYLTHLYIACGGVLVASRAEGFGLPLIEATRHNKPILARDIPVFREFHMAGLHYFNSDTSLGLATSLSAWIKNRSKPENPSPTFPTWDLSAAQLLHCLGLQNHLSSFSKNERKIINKNPHHPTAFQQ